MAKTAKAGTLAVHLTANANDLERTLKGGIQSLRGFALAAAAAFGVNSLKDFAKESLNLYGIQQQNENRLAGVLKSTGYAAGLTAKELKNHASELQGMTTVGDESILKLQTTLLAFTGVAGNEFKRATALALDMSEVLGTGATENIKKLGKSLDDPKSALTGLMEVGVFFSEQQKAQITQLADAGKKREAQLIILEELERHYGGAAAAAADTVLGRQTQMLNAWGDLKEGIGNVLAQSLALGDGYAGLTAKFSEWASWLNQNADAIGFSIQSVFIDIQAGFQTVWAAAKGVFDFIWNLVKHTTNVVLVWPFQFLLNGLKAINAGLWDITNLVIRLAKEAWKAITGQDYDFKGAFKNFGTEFGKILDENKPVVGLEFKYDQWGNFKKELDEIDRNRVQKQMQLERGLLERRTKQNTEDNERGNGKNVVSPAISVPPVAKLAAVALQGSLEAYQARMNQSKNIPEQQLKIQEQQLAAQQETNRLLKGGDSAAGIGLETAMIGG